MAPSESRGDSAENSSPGSHSEPAIPVSDAHAMAWNALCEVYDPELGIDIVSLGLVYDVRTEADRIVVDMTLTTPGCPASATLPEMARLAVSDALAGSMTAQVNVVWEPPWNPSMMQDGGIAGPFRGM